MLKEIWLAEARSLRLDAISRELLLLRLLKASLLGILRLSSELLPLLLLLLPAHGW